MEATLLVFPFAMVLGRDARALVDAELTATYSRKGVDFSLLASECKALGDYFADADMDVNAIQWDVDKADTDSWEDLWRAYAEDAGLKGKAQAVRVLRFLKARGETGAGKDAYKGRAKGIVDLLTVKGISVSDDTILELEGCLIREEAGDINAQSTCIEVIWLLYLCELPSAAVSTWYESQKTMMHRVGKMAPIELRTNASYKEVVKDSTTPVLERVLSSWTSQGYSQWTQYYHSAKARLHGNGFPLAARRLEEIVSRVEEQFCSAENGKALMRRYLWNYFFIEFMGLGMPEEKGTRSWDRVMQPPKGGEMQSLLDERPTMAKEAAASQCASMVAAAGGAPNWWQQQAIAMGMAPSQVLDARAMGASFEGMQWPTQQPQNAWATMPWSNGFMPQWAGSGWGTQPANQMRGSGGGPSQPPILEIPQLEDKKRGPCAFCEGAHDLSDCTRFRDAKRKDRTEQAAKIAARKAAQAARLEAEGGTPIKE